MKAFKIEAEDINQILLLDEEPIEELIKDEGILCDLRNV